MLNIMKRAMRLACRTSDSSKVIESNSLQKALPEDWLGRFREICSDPINLLITRVPNAGSVQDGKVVLHNGNQVAVSGPYSYYGRFSEILVINRGVHEPLEEYLFQLVLSRLQSTPVMLELGSYWCHYSMWFKKCFPDGISWMVEPDSANLVTGKNNFEANGFSGEFIQAFVGNNGFKVDEFMGRNEFKLLDILHSDIQGFELEMLSHASKTLADFRVNYVFVSTHSQHLHSKVEEFLSQIGYRIEASSDFQTGSTSFDGLVLASSPRVPQLFQGTPFDRAQLPYMSSVEKLANLSSLIATSVESF